MKKSAVVFASVLTGALSVLAADPIAFKGQPAQKSGKPNATTLKYESGDGAISNGWYPLDYAGWMTADYWPDGVLPTAGGEYIIKSDKMASCGAEGYTTFPAKLTLSTKDSGQWGTGGLSPAKDAAVSFDGDGLFIENGRISFNQFSVNSSTGVGGRSTLNGKITVCSDGVSDIAELQCRYSYNLDVTVNAAIAGGDSSILTVYSYGNWNPHYSGKFAICRFLGDLSGFTGTIKAGAYGNLFFDQTVFSGKVYMSHARATLNQYTPWLPGYAQIGELEFASTNIVKIGIGTVTNYLLRVERGVTVPDSAQAGTAAGPSSRWAMPHSRMVGNGKPKIRLYIDSAACTRNNLIGRDVPILDLPASGPSVLDLFSVELDQPYILGVDGSNGKMAALVSLEEKVEGDRRRLYVNLPKSTYSTRDASYQGDIFTPAGNDAWIGGVKDQPLDPETVYVAPYSSNLPRGTWTFGGKALVCPPDTYPTAWGNPTINDFRLEPGSYFQTGDTYVLNGNLTICDCPSQFDADGVPSSGIYFVASDAKGIVGTIASAMHGDGAAWFAAASWSSHQNRSAKFVLSGDNSDFNGFMLIRQHYYSTENNVSVEVAASRACNLGGPVVGGFCYRALNIEKGGVLKATDTFALTEPTRGVRIGAPGRVTVADGKTFTLGTQTTYCGELVKDGTGTLALQGACRFGTSQSETPDGNNLVTVKAGRLSGLAKAATDGLAVTFAEGTGLTLPSPLTASEEAKAFGFYDKKGSIDLSACGGRLSVVFDQTDRADWPETFDLAVCTLPTAAAEALSGKIDVSRPKGYTAKLLSRANDGDDTVTYYVHCEKSGFLLLFR